MRKLLALVSLLAAACGDDSSSGGGGAQLGGTVGGRAFTISEVKAIPATTGATPCAGVPVVGTIGINGFALEVTSYANACGDYTSTGCTLHKNAQSVTVLFARIAIATPQTPTPAAPPLAPGTYPIHPSATAVEPDGTSGYLFASSAVALATNDACVATSPAVQSGTLRIDQVSGPVTGHVSVSFANGDSLQGDFTAPLCTGAGPDVCSIVTSGAANPLCPGTPACVQ